MRWTQLILENCIVIVTQKVETQKTQIIPSRL